jgi:hypothetical protein
MIQFNFNSTEDSIINIIQPLSRNIHISQNTIKKGSKNRALQNM